jgi:hypothetical protein
VRCCCRIMPQMATYHLEVSYNAIGVAMRLVDRLLGSQKGHVKTKRHRGAAGQPFALLTATY